jgi:uncharacterized protein (DUF1778 family)
MSNDQTIYTETVSARLAPSLIAKLEAAAHAAGVTRSKFVAKAVAAYLSAEACGEASDA